MPKTLENILLWLLRIGLLLTLLSPVVYSTGYLFPYVVPRATFFQIITELLFGIALILALVSPYHRPRFTPLVKALLFFFAVATITTLTSADVSKSFIGTIERSLGLFNILHYGMLFFAATIAFTVRTQWLAVFTTSILVSIYISIDFLSGVAGGENAFSSSLMGNPTFLSGYLIFHIYFASELFLQTRKKWLKWMLVPVAALFIVALFASQVRGGFIGFSAGIAFLLTYYAWKQKTMRPLLIGLILVSVAGYSIIYTNRNHPDLKTNPIIQRLTNFSLQDETIRARFAMWRMAIAGVKDRPIVGWGRENFSLVFNQYFDPSFDEAKVAESWEDRAHNIIFDELVIGGALGLLAYFVLIGTAAYTLRKSPLALALLIAYFVQALFGVETLNTYLPFFLFLAYNNCKYSDKQYEHEHTPHTLRINLLGACTLAVLIVIPFLLISIQVMRGNKIFHKTIQNMAQNNYLAFESSYNEAKSQYAYFPALTGEALTTLHSYLFQIAYNFSQLKVYSLYAAPLLNDLDVFSKRTPSEQRLTFMLANAYMFQGAETNNPAFIDKAEMLIAKLLENAPTRKVYVETKNRLQAFRQLSQTKK